MHFQRLGFRTALDAALAIGDAHFVEVPPFLIGAHEGYVMGRREKVWTIYSLEAATNGLQYGIWRHMQDALRGAMLPFTESGRLCLAEEHPVALLKMRAFDADIDDVSRVLFEQLAPRLLSRWVTDWCRSMGVPQKG